MRRFYTIPFLLVLSLAWAWSVSAQGTDTIGLGKNPAGEGFLVDAKGMTLYYYAKDKDGQSACTGGCLKAWPAFLATTVKVSAPLKASDFGVITRADGAQQTTYQGWPLYYWASDEKPGDATGDGVGKVWFVVKVPRYTVMLSNDKTLGNFLVDGNGMALYWFTQDSPGSSSATGKTLVNWPIFAPASFILPSLLNPADFKTIIRADGAKQATFKGYPLYYFVKDTKRGDVNGQDVGKVWYLIDPLKFPPSPM